MTAHEVASFMLASCPSLRHYHSYMFGSSLRGIGVDIDLLMVGPPGAPLSSLKSEIRTAGEQLPLHVIYMSPSEVAETMFISRAGCVALEELALLRL